MRRNRIALGASILALGLIVGIAGLAITWRILLRRLTPTEIPEILPVRV